MAEAVLENTVWSWKLLWNVEPGNTNPGISHPIIHIQPFWIVCFGALVNTCWENNVRHEPVAFFWCRRGQKGRGRAIAYPARILRIQYDHASRILQTLLHMCPLYQVAGDPVIDDEPAMPGENWRRPSSNFDIFPGLLRNCQQMGILNPG